MSNNGRGPRESFGHINGLYYVACAGPPEESDPAFIWIKMPERQPMRFKDGKWVPWLNAPVGWANCIDTAAEENRWLFPDC